VTHTRASVSKRVEAEYKTLDAVVRTLKPADWRKPAMREEAPIRFTAKDVLAHINAWKFRQARVTANDKRPLRPYEPPKTGAINDTNAGIYKRSHRTPAKTIVAEHRAAQRAMRSALRAAGVLPQATLGPVAIRRGRSQRGAPPQASGAAPAGSAG
jgi:hypothetical protein